MPLVVKKTPTPAPYFQPSSQVPFIFTATADEAWQVQPIPASYLLEIAGTPFGGGFTLDGITFVIENSNDFTPTTFKRVTSNPVATLTNLTGAMASRPKFLENWVWYITATTGGALLTIIAKSASYIASTFSANITTGTPPITDEFTANVIGILKPNFRFVYQISFVDTFAPSVETPCHPLQYVEPKITQITNIDDVYINLSEVVRGHLTTELTQLRCDEGLWNYNSGKVFTIRYGTSSTLFDGSEEVYLYSAGDYFMLNSAIDTIEGVERYTRITVGTTAKALNQMFDANVHLSPYSVAWAYIYYNGLEYVQSPQPIEVKLIVEAIQFTGLNNYGILERRELIVDDLNSHRKGVASLPIGMANLGLIYDTRATKVLCTFKTEALMPDSSTQYRTIGSQIYDICDCCSDGLEVYFLGRTGAYETLVFPDYKYVTTTEVTQNEFTSEKYARNFNPNDASLINDYLKRSAKGGTVQFNGTATKDIKLSYTARPNKELTNFLESFLLSDSRFLRTRYDSIRGWLYATQFNIKHSSSEIDRNTGLLKFEVTISIDSTQLAGW